MFKVAARLEFVAKGINYEAFRKGSSTALTNIPNVQVLCHDDDRIKSKAVSVPAEHK